MDKIGIIPATFLNFHSVTLSPPPTVPGWPIVGSAFQALGRDPRDFLLDQYHRLGPVFRLQAMHIDYVIMAGPEANQFANGEGRDYFQSRTFWKGMMRELEADNFLIGLDGEDHSMLRKMFRKNFSRTAIDPHREAISGLCVAMFRDIGEGAEFEVVERVLQLTSQMIGCVMTGEVPGRKELDNFLYYINSITNHFTLHRLPAWLLKFRPFRFRQAKKMTMAFAEGVIERHLTRTGDLHNFVDAVMEAAEKCPHLFTHGDIRFSAILPLFAGIDTLGQTINYALYELHKNPGILDELQEEIDAVFCGGIPDTAELKTMEILNNVIMETLRLHPSAFGMVRTANRDLEFADCLIKKDQDVVILTTAPHFMEAYFREPKKFDIARYLPPRNEHRQRNVFAPFGRGPHTCLGAGMAESLMALSLGSILYHYRLELVDPNKKYKERINPTPSLGRQFRLKMMKKVRS
jgi:cytochrome P450